MIRGLGNGSWSWSWVQSATSAAGPGDNDDSTRVTTDQRTITSVRQASDSCTFNHDQHAYGGYLESFLYRSW